MYSPWLSHVPLAPAARPYRSWLCEKNSLTQRWQKASGAFHVTPVRQALLLPFNDEQHLLHTPPRQRAWVRDVVLHCGTTPVAFAHTVAPVLPRGPVAHWLQKLGSRSLGTLLFSHPGFIRQKVEYAAIDARHPLHGSIYFSSVATQRYWARRTLFSFGLQRVLLTEVFLPAVLAF
ncbi:MAG: chorismate lyase [Rhodocyclales bacterium]|jgi:chorismate--pyruvate lyase|nr:chorismate lyase [Rhodocyclales bacterium]